MAAFTAIDDAGVYFKTVIYSGDDGTQAITGVGFQPDFLWEAKRSATGNKYIFDSVRGVGGAAEQLETSSTAGESQQANMIQSFDSDGFTQGSDMNASGTNFVAWNWKCGTTSGVDFSPGDLTPSSYSINADSGVGIYVWAGTNTADQTMCHGLGAVPKMMIVKGTSESYNWYVYHASMGPTKSLKLNATTAQETATQYWQDTAPTSTLYTMGTYLNTTTTALITYIFTEKQGYSKFGSYEGTGDADGAYIYTGFRPAFLLTKNIDAAGYDWYIFDNKRDGINPKNWNMFVNATDAEGSTERVELLSNGFKCITAGTPNSAHTYIYAAFAESPFVNSSGVPTNAR